jgi:hypothetical protein
MSGTAGSSFLPASTTLAKWATSISREIDSYVGEENTTEDVTTGTVDEYVAAAAARMMDNKLLQYLQMKNPDKWQLTKKGEKLEVEIMDDTVIRLLEFYMDKNGLFDYA